MSGDASGEGHGATSMARRCPHCGNQYPFEQAHDCPAALAATASQSVDQAEPLTKPTLPEPTLRREAEDLIGVILGERYEIQEKLSRGGMGVVYKARHVVLESTLAVKFLLRPQDEEARHRFLLEAKLASKISHPNTVAISDFGVLADGRSYLVMEYLRGPTLAKVLKTAGRMDAARACHIALQIARGLHAVHEQGVVHRDLKPENIFLLEHDGKGDFVKIVDFGIALLQGAVTIAEPGAAASGVTAPPGETKPGVSPAAGARAAEPASKNERGPAPSSLSAGERYTLPGTLLGTPLYMSPEQVRAGAIDARADQYALGCILYELLVGEVPFTAPTVSKLLYKHLTEAPEPLRKRRPGLAIRASLEGLVLRLLAKDPDTRFPSMHAVEEALEAELAALQPRSGLRGLARSTQALLLAPLLLSLAGLGYAVLRLRQDPDRNEPGMSGAELSSLRQQAVAALKLDLASASPTLRRGALQRLGHGGDGITRSDIEPLLRDPQDEVRAQAALALGGLADRQAIASLQPLLASTQPVPVRVAAATALDALGDAQGRSFLRDTLTKERGDLQLRAAYVLCDRGDADALPVLRQYAAQSTGPAMLPLWARLLHCGDPSAREKLRAELVQTPERALAAAASLTQEGDEQGLAYLRARLQKREADQLSAARVLAAQGDVAALALLRQVIRDRQPAAAALQVAAEGLGPVGERGDARHLGAHFARSQVPELRQGLASAIVQIADHEPSALSQQGLLWAQAAILSDDWLTRRGAADVLGDSSAPEAVQLLTQLSKDGDSRVRRSAVRALGRKRERPALVALAGTLRDGDVQVRREALFSIERVAERMAAGSLASLVKDLSGWLAETLKTGTPEEQILSSGLLLRLGDEGQRTLFSSFLTSTDELLRKLAVLKAPAEVALLSPLVGDAAYGVRFAAAVRLASLLSTSPTPAKEPLKHALQEGVAHGGADAIAGYAGLRKIGATDTEPPNLDAALKGSDLENRLAAVDASTLLPLERALGLLALAAQDRDPQVRQRVAELVAELPVVSAETTGRTTENLPSAAPLPAAALRPIAESAAARSILRRLATDSDPLVRSRAQVLLSRVLQPGVSQVLLPGAASAEKAASPPRPSLVLPDGGMPDAGSVPDAASDRSAGRPTLAPGLATSPETEPRSPIGSAKEPAAAVDTATGKSPDATSQLFEKVQQALAKKDTERARKGLAKALAKCAKASSASPLCAKLAFESTVSLGQTYEAKSFWVDAMQEYEQLVARASALKLSPEQVSALQASMTKLKPSLGLIVISKQAGKKCQVIRRWVKTGMTQIDIDGEAQSVEVEAGETKNFGTCR